MSNIVDLRSRPRPPKPKEAALLATDPYEVRVDRLAEVWLYYLLVKAKGEMASTLWRFPDRG